ncbi:MAG: hydantoinase/oxoprolinase family protein, partial [Oceanidesulfovibrio sp.]
IDIHTVGAGGGSIAAVDAGGPLTVGPESAGADPGPICYGKGSDITVTDANLYLGRLIPEHFLGGNMALDLDALDKPFTEMSARLGLAPVELAEGILAVANANMERAIRVISVERGFDPREFTLFSFGGAGGLHAAYLARLLNMERVFIPKNPGILSALGMLLADIVKDYSHTVMVEAASSTPETIAAALAPLEARGAEDLAAEGIGPERTTFERYLDMRYEGQSYEILTPFDPDAKDMDAVVEVFHELHERTYGYRNQAKPVQVVNVRLRARGAPTKPSFATSPLAGETPPESADLGAREVIFEGEAHATRVYRREELEAGNVIPGPAVLVEYTSTLLVPPFATAVVDEYENLILTIS